MLFEVLMYPMGDEINWFRHEPTRKTGPAPPHRVGFGESSIKILQDGLYFYIGTEFIEASGASRPFKRFSQNFRRLSDAKRYYTKLTAKPAKKLEEFFYRCYPNLCEASNIERETILFDFRDTIVGFLEKRGYFDRGKTPITLIIKIENFVSDLIQQSLRRVNDIKNREEMGFGIP